MVGNNDGGAENSGSTRKLENEHSRPFSSVVVVTAGSISQPIDAASSEV